MSSKNIKEIFNECVKRYEYLDFDYEDTFKKFSNLPINNYAFCYSTIIKYFNTLLKNCLEKDSNKYLKNILNYYLSKYTPAKTLVIIANLLNSINYNLTLQDGFLLINNSDIKQYIMTYEFKKNKYELLNVLLLAYHIKNKEVYESKYSNNIYDTIYRYPFLTNEEMDLLIKEYKNNNDLKAREILIKSHLRLVLKYARLNSRFTSSKFDDLFQEGCRGLIESIDSYDYNLKTSITTYAIWKIKYYMGTFMQNNHLNKLTNHYYKKLKLIRSKEDKFLKIYHRFPTIKELSSYTNIKEEEITSLKLYEQEFISLDNPYQEDMDYEYAFIEYIGNSYNMTEKIDERLSDGNIFKVMFKVLDDREIYIIVLYKDLFIGKYNLEEISNILHVSHQRVSQLYNEAVLKIKKELEGNGRNYNRVNTIRFLINECDDDILFRAIKNLPIPYQTLLAKRYNNNLTKIISDDITFNEFLLISFIIVPKINSNIINIKNNKLLLIKS